MPFGVSFRMPVGRALLALASLASALPPAACRSRGPAPVPAEGELIAQVTRTCCDGIAFDPTGQVLATISGGAITLWDVESRLEIRSLLPPRREVKGRPSITFASESFVGLAFDPSGRFVASTAASARGRLTRDPTYRLAVPNVWEVDAGRDLSAGEWAYDPEKQLPVNPRLSFDGREPLLWQESRSASVVAALLAYRGPAETFSPDGRLGVRATGRDGQPQVIEAYAIPADRLLWRATSAHQRFVFDLRFSPDGRWLVTSAWDGSRVLDARSGQEVPTSISSLKNWRAVAFSEDGRHLAFAGPSYVRVVPVPAWNRFVDVPFPQGEYLSALAFSPVGQILAGAFERRIHFWEVPSGRELPPLELEGAQRVSAVAFDPDGASLAAGAEAGGFGPFSVLRWPLKERGGPVVLSESSEGIPSIAVSPDGRHLAWTSFQRKGPKLALERVQGTTRVCRLPECAEPKDLLNDEGSADGENQIGQSEAAAEALAFTPDGRMLLVAAYENAAYTDEDIEFATRGRILRFTVPDFEREPAIETKSRRIAELAVSPDSSRFAAALDDSAVALWQRSGSTRMDIRPAPGRDTNPYARAHTLAFSPDGAVLATGAEDGRLMLWGSGDGHSIRTLGEEPRGVRSVRFSPDGRHLAATRCDLWPPSGRAEGVIEIWDTDAWKLARTIPVSPECPDHVAFSPDGRWIASTGEAGVRVWDPATGALRLTLALGSPGDWLAWSPDGRFDGTEGAVARLAAVRNGHRAYRLNGHPKARRTPGLVTMLASASPGDPPWSPISKDGRPEPGRHEEVP